MQKTAVKPRNRPSVLEGGLSDEAVKAMRGKIRPEPLGGHPQKTVVRTKPAKRERVYKEVTATVRQGKNALTVEEAMELIGWTPVDEGEFHLRDIHGVKVFLKNNATNRPFRDGLAKRYASEILRNKWKLNGETMVFDWFGDAQSCQHRLVAFILAEQMRREDVGKKGGGQGWKDKCKVYWGHGGPLTMEVILVRGINPSPEVIDTLDLGQKRTLGDLFYREERFAGPSSVEEEKQNGKQMATPRVSTSTRRQLCNILANATRLVWLRAGGKSISDAPHFPHSEALDFINAHKRIEDCILYIWGLEGGMGKGGKHISRFLSLGYAAGLLYLMSTSTTEPDDFVEKGVEALDFKLEKKAKEFWAKVASGAKLETGDPILVLREALPKVDAGSGLGRDEIVGMVIKAFNLWVDGQKKVQDKDVAMKKRTDDLDRPKLAEEPRLGGIDVAGPEKPDPLDILTVDDNREGHQQRKDKTWSEGDTCWVRDADGEHWFGTIDEVVKGPSGTVANITDVDTGIQWEEALKNLWLKYPG
jgi:hypothetical protein